MALQAKNNIINAHTHVFNGKNIPPFISRTFIPWPFYYLVNIPLILAMCKWYYNSPTSPYKWIHQGWYKGLVLAFYKFRVLILRTTLLKVLVLDIINPLIAYHGIIYLIDWLLSFWIKPTRETHDSALSFVQWLRDHNLFYYAPDPAIRAVVIIFTFLFIATGRKLITFILKQFWSFLKFIPDKTTIQFIGRFINIGRFAYYDNSTNIFKRLNGQYSPGTGFVILPMDMEFMEAGKVSQDGRYRVQMDKLNEIRENKKYKAYPFVFVDPRRKMVDEQPFFEWTGNSDGTITLKECFIKEFIEAKKFSGFKIYPALGYYPFDKRLLPLWKYAADHQLPIMTHCIRGTIFYRGPKKSHWDYHPIFKSCADEKLNDLLLPELKNIDFINNFTHPLNYLCLVEEPLLRVVVRLTEDNDIKALFGYTDEQTKLKYDLKELKLCFGHYGGDDEWKHYFERDRDLRSLQFTSLPDRGINFKPDASSEVQEDDDTAPNATDANKNKFNINGIAYSRLEQIWQSSDWYTIISSMMIQYPNLYADISYIIHDTAIFSLLKTTLKQEKLKTRVLFGTDFYVVRNHKSEKEMLADAMAALSEKEFDLIARLNPAEFLKQRMPPSHQTLNN